MRSGIVYKITYSCGSAYISQARCTLLCRIKEHTTSQQSEVCKNLLQLPTHRFDINTLTIFGNENDIARMSTLESLFIQKQTPDLNNDSQSSPLKNF